ncbi:MAG: S8 family serine peptidase [Pseudomonadota bacterium]
MTSSDDNVQSYKERLKNRKIDPRLRLLGNCDEEVCSVRAETDAALAFPLTFDFKSPLALAAPTFEKLARDKKPSKGHMESLVHDVRVSVFLRLATALDSGSLEEIRRISGIKDLPQRGEILTLELPLDRLPDLADLAGVVSIEVGDRVRVPPVLEGAESVAIRKPPSGLRRVQQLSKLHAYGEGVLIGIIDVGGLDFAHEDFLSEDGLETRIERIWDMGGDFRDNPAKSGMRSEFNYGSEFRREHLNAAITSAKKIGVSPHDIEVQGHRVKGSHATHVASIAAGNRGVCRNAKIAAVMLDLEDDIGKDRRKSFYDSVRIAHAVDYLFQLADELGSPGAPLPVSINISLGTNAHAHDGSSAASRWIDNALVEPGRVVCVAAGNSGQEAPTYSGDLGYLMGRIHSSGQVRARGLTQALGWVVVGDGIADMSENEMEIWYEPQDRLSVVLEAPNGQKFGPVQPGEFIENLQISNGSMISIYNELYRPANGCNTISIYLTPFKKSPYVGVPSGEWRVVLRGEDIRDGCFHAWIDRDDPRPHFRKAGDLYADYPSHFIAQSNVDSHSINSLGCGERIIAVGNYDHRARMANISSSQGPTRINRPKPEILAPGTEIVAANGFTGRTNEWIAKTGTSMASPYVCGVCGLMLGVNPQLTAAQMIGIIRRTAQPLENGDYSWQDDSGFGMINAADCIDEAERIRQPTELA